MTSTTTTKTEYCGYVCSSAKEEQQRIIDELIDFSKYNPEYAAIMLGKLMEMLYEARNKLANNETAVMR